MNKTMIRAAGMGLIIGLFDLGYDLLLHQPAAFATIHPILPPLLATALVFAGIYAALWLTTKALLRRWVAGAETAAALALGVALTTAFVLATALDLFRFAALATWPLVELLLILLAAAAAAGMAHRVVARIRSREGQVGGRGVRVAAVFSNPRLLIAAFSLLMVASSLSLALGDRRLAPTAGPDAPGNRPIKRIILISVDTLRPDHLTTYDPTARTVHSDRLARDGVTFEKATSPAPWTLPAFASLFTGVTLQTHRTGRVDSLLPPELPTLAGCLSAAGYHTAAIGNNPFLTRQRAVGGGFTSYDFFPGPGVGGSFGAKLVYLWWLEDRFSPYASTARLTDRARRFVGANRDTDFFLWLHYFDPHTPYAPPPAYQPASPTTGRIAHRLTNAHKSAIHAGSLVPTPEEVSRIRRLYDGEVRYVDDNIGQLLTELDALGIYDDALIILVSDHGEELWEHGGFTHGHSTYEELLWVPLLVKLPRSLAPPAVARVPQRVAVQGLMSTILGLTGSPCPEPVPRSPSLAGQWRVPEAPPGPAIFSSGVRRAEERETVHWGSMKYTEYSESDRQDLFDLSDDPKELRSLITESTQGVSEGRELLRQNREAAAAARRRAGIDVDPTLPLDPETARNLGLLGYIR